MFLSPVVVSTEEPNGVKHEIKEELTDTPEKKVVVQKQMSKVLRETNDKKKISKFLGKIK